MPENARLTGSLDQIQLALWSGNNTAAVDEAEYSVAPRRTLASNTVPILGVFGVDRVRSTVHNWVHKAELQPKTGQRPDQVAVDETVIRLEDEQYWLYATVDPDTNELLHTKLGSTRNNAFANAFIHELREKHAVDDAVMFVDGAPSLQTACRRHGLAFRYEKHGDRHSVERTFREIKLHTSSFSNCFSHARAETADTWLRSFAFAWNQLI